jgi:hypothetical protein
LVISLEALAVSAERFTVSWWGGLIDEPHQVRFGAWWQLRSMWDKKMTKLTAYMMAAALLAFATVAIAQTAPTTNDQPMAAPTAADSAKFIDDVNAARTASKCGQEAMPGASPKTPEAPADEARRNTTQLRVIRLSRVSSRGSGGFTITVQGISLPVRIFPLLIRIR